LGGPEGLRYDAPPLVLKRTVVTVFYLSHLVEGGVSLKAVIDICRKDLVLGQALGKQLKVFTPTLYALALGNEAVSYEDILATWRAVSGDRDDLVRRGGEDEARP